MCVIVQERHFSDYKQSGPFHTFGFWVFRHLSRRQELKRFLRLLKPILNLGNLHPECLCKERLYGLTRLLAYRLYG